MEFNLFILAQNTVLVDDPYFAVSTDCTRLLRISGDLIHFDSATHESDIDSLVQNYMLTSRTIRYDLEHFDRLVKQYTGYDKYSCAAHFIPDGNHLMLTYPIPPEWKHFIELIDSQHENPYACQILNEINLGLSAILPSVFAIL